MTLFMFASYSKMVLTLSSKFIVSEKTPSASSSFFNQPGSQSVCRPLKVEHASNKDRDWVLQNAKMLIAAYKNGQVRIAKFLSTSELEYIKKLRADCALLNMSSACFSSDGRSKYVVIDDRIMESLDSGKLAPYYNSVNSKLIVSSNIYLQAENGQSSNMPQQQLQQH